MAYASVSDMIDAFGESELVDVTTPAGMDRLVIDQERVTTALGVASDEIDSYLRRRYAVPLVSVSPMLQRACCVLARWILWSRTSTAPSDAMRADRKDTITWLGNINNGSVTLDGAVALNVGNDFSRIATRPPAIGYGLC